MKILKYGILVNLRNDKFKPNNKKIVDTIISYFKNPWNLNLLKNYVPNYYQDYQNKNSSFTIKSSIQLKQILKKYLLSNKKILDIGCGYKSKNNSKILNSKNLLVLIVILK